MRTRNYCTALLLCILAIPLLCAIDFLGQTSSGTTAQTAFGHMEIWVRGSDTGYALRASIRLQGPRSVTLDTDAAGRATLQLPAGEYAVTVTAPGYKPMTLALNLAAVANQNNHINLDPVGVSDEERPEAIRAQMHLGWTLVHGFVVDDDSGKPLAGVAVRLGNSQADTDARGHYFVSVPTPPIGDRGPEPLTLTFRKPGYKTVLIENFTVFSDEIGKHEYGDRARRNSLGSS